MECAIVVVGDEILAGHVADANAPFLIGRIVANGHRVRRVCIVGDDPEQISADIATELDGPSGLVVVCGGLGPTHDDRTMEGVARALGRPIEPCAELVEQIEAVLAVTASEGFSDDAIGGAGFRKMALAPAGAEFLRCSLGIVPAVAVNDPRGTVIVLPGPPRELRAVFSEVVEPRFLRGTGRNLHREELTHPFPEASLALLLTDLQERFPSTSIGSYPRADDALIRITGPSQDVAAVADAVRGRIAEMSASTEGRRLIAFMQRRRAQRFGAESG